MPETEVQTGKRGRKAAIRAEKAAQQEPEPEKPSRPPKKGKATPAPAGGPTFWQKVAAVNKEDWGTRAQLYLYRVEPVIDRRRAGSQTYITKYAEPISEDRILADHGSGRYKVILNFRKAGAEQGDEIDSIYLDLLNLQFPPKIAPGDWVDDPNNKKWAWAKQHFPNEHPQQSGVDPLKMLDTYNRIRKDVAEEHPQVEPEERMLALATVLEKLQPKQSSPDEQMKNLAITLQALRPSESVTAAIEKRIEAAEKRANDLLVMLLSRDKKAEDSGGIKGIVTAVKELEPLIEKFLPGLASKAGDVLSGGTHSRMSGMQEFILGLAPQARELFQPFSMLFAELIANRAMQATRPPVAHTPALPAPAGNPAPAQAQNDGAVVGFLGMLSNPMLAKVRLAGPPENIDPAELGDEFGSWVLEGYGVDPQYPEAIKMAKAFGPVGIIAQFRAVPSIWNNKGRDGKQLSLAELEPKLTPFFQAFLDYKPDSEHDSEDEPEPEDPIRPEVVNFDQEYQNA